jgi:DNA repair protein SbcD/Mre11
VKLLAFADLHLGAGTSLGREPGDRLRDQAEVLERIFDVATSESVDAVLLAGDLFEGPTITPQQLEVFADAVEAHLGGSIPIVAINGNGRHDLAMRDVNALAPLRHIPDVHVYSRPALHDLGAVQIACLPWVSPARLVAQNGGDAPRDEINAVAAALLVEVASAIADPRVRPTVLLMHGSLSGASLPQGIATDLLREPVVDVDALLELGFATIIAGHIHAPQIAGPHGWSAVPGAWEGNALPADPFALYTGSPMPLNFGETHVQHGCWIVGVETEITRAEFVPIDSRPFRRSELNLADLETASGDAVAEFDGILDPAAWPDVADAIVKVTVRATQAQQRRLEVHRLRDAILTAGAHTVKIEIDTVREDRARVESVTDELEPVDAFDAWAVAQMIPPKPAATAREQLQDDLEQVAS